MYLKIYILFFLGILSLLLLLLLLLLTIIVIDLMLKLLYEKASSSFALKVIIGKQAYRIVKPVEEKKEIEVSE